MYIDVPGSHMNFADAEAVLPVCSDRCRSDVEVAMYNV